MKILLDTCAIIWTVSNPERLTEIAKSAITSKTAEIFVSPISCAEIACLSERRRIELDRHWKTWFNHFIEINGWTVVPIDLKIIQEAYSLPGHFHEDPADRIIVATARSNECHIVTSDRKILDYPDVKAIWK
ncbi:MAG: type II toxin-antitoxin system VapC family toxin [Victivallales bacterium]